MNPLYERSVYADPSKAWQLLKQNSAEEVIKKLNLGYVYFYLNGPQISRQINNTLNIKTHYYFTHFQFYHHPKLIQAFPLSHNVDDTILV
jgi:hypothetical protein